MKRVSLFLVVAATRLFGEDDAASVWARVLAARGGVERLHAIQNVVVREVAWKRELPVQVRLFQFPDGSWLYRHDRHPDLGKTLYTQRGAMSWTSLQIRGRPVSTERLPHGLPIHRREYIRLHALFLLESKAMRAEVGRLQTDRHKGAPEWVLEVGYDGAQFRLFIDQRTALVRRVEPLNQEARNCLYVQKYNDIVSYRQAGAMRLPSEIRISWRIHWKVEVEVDAPLRPDLFTSPPNVGDGPTAWRATTR